MKYLKTLIFFIFLTSITSCYSSTNVNQQDNFKNIDPSVNSVHSLIQDLNSNNNKNLRKTIKRLRLMGDTAVPAIPKLLEILSEPPRYLPKIQMEAMLAVADIAPDSNDVMNSLLLKLTSPNEEIRKKALEAIYNTQTNDPTIINIFKKIGEEDVSRMVRKVARRYYQSLEIKQLAKRRK